MPTLLDHILGFFLNYQAKVQDEDSETTQVMRFWPRKLNYTSGPDICDEDEQDRTCDSTYDDDEENKEVCEDDENSKFGGDEGEECPCEPSRFARKMKFVTRAAKYGMKEGALCGIFFGGGWGVYKWLDGKYISGNGGGNEEGGENEDSTTNTNLIFVTAANSAIAMGIVCTVICCTKAIVYCN